MGGRGRGRGGGGGGGGRGKPNPRNQYFQAIKDPNGKMDTLRWCLKHGGINIRAEDEDGHTGIQIACAMNKPESLAILIEHAKKFGTQEDLDFQDDEDRTPLMMAVNKGSIACVKLLYRAGANVNLKDEKGKTAKDHAEFRKNPAIIDFLANPTMSDPVSKQEEPEEDDEEDEKAKKTWAAASGANQTAKLQEAVHQKKLEEKEAIEATMSSAPAAQWPEVARVLETKENELTIRKTGVVEGVDPALWNCVCLHELRLQLEEGSLVELPPQVSNLNALTTLILNGNKGLTSLPESLGSLAKLKNLEVADNRLSSLPKSLGQLEQLEVVDLSDNALTGVAELSGLENLVSVTVDRCKLTALALDFGVLKRLQVFSAADNEITEFPPGMGMLQAMKSLNLKNNQIREVPMQFGNLTEKKLQSVLLDDNPLNDARIKRFVEKGGSSLVKDLLMHVRKNGYKGDTSGGGGKSKGKGKKGKGKQKQVEEEEEEGSDDNILAMLDALNNKDSDED